MEFKIQIFQASKVMELGLGPGKSWKLVENKPDGCHISDPCACFCSLHTLLLYTIRLVLHIQCYMKKVLESCAAPVLMNIRLV